MEYAKERGCLALSSRLSRADFAFVQNPAPLPDSVNGLLIHSAQHAGKQSVLYASGSNGYRLRSTMSLTSGGVVASFCKPGQEDLHLLDVNLWTSVTLESATQMVQELGRANSFFAKKLPKRVIFAGHLVDNSPVAQKRQRGFIRSWSRPSEDTFKPLAKAGLRDCATKFDAITRYSARQLRRRNRQQALLWASKDAYENLRQLNVFLDDQILTFGQCNPIVADYNF